MTLKKILFVTFSVLLFTTIALPQKKESNKQLLGRWATISQKGERSKTMITFHANGTVEYDIAAVIQGSYSLNRNVLITYFNGPKENRTEIDTSIIKIEGDTLFQSNLHRGEKILIKSVKLGEKTLGGGIIGKWLSQNFNGHKAIQEFSNNRLVTVDLIVRSINGTYKVSGNSLTLNLELTPVIKFKFKIEKGVMTIIRSGQNGEKKLIKVDSN